MIVLLLILLDYSSIFLVFLVPNLDSIRLLIDYLFVRSEPYSPLFDIHVQVGNG